MPIDQTHEQNNALIKGSGGAIGLLLNPVTLGKWLLAGPEQARLIKEFEEQFLESKDDDDHDEGYSMQSNFRMKDMENPFLDQSEDLSTLNVEIVMERSAVDAVFTNEV